MKKEMNLFEMEEKMAKNFINTILNEDKILANKIDSFTDKDDFIKNLIFEISWRYAFDSTKEEVKWFIELFTEVHHNSKGEINMKKNNDLNLILKGVILNNNQLKDMFDLAEDRYESNLSFNDLQLWYLDIVEMDLNNYLYDNQLDVFEINVTNWLYNYLEFELLDNIAC